MVEHSPGPAEASNRRARRWWQTLAEACRLTAQPADSGALGRLLQLAAEASEVDRAYVVAHETAARLDAKPEAVELFRRCAAIPRGLSRTLVARAIEQGGGSLICPDAATDAHLRAGASVRGLSLRGVAAAPIPGRRSALVLDSRRPLDRDSVDELSVLVAIFACLCSMIPEPAAGSASAAPLGPAARSPAMRRTLEWLGRVAPTELPVLIHGETGSGKERVARAVHLGSRRAGARFVAINCAALPESLLEVELFGCLRGAYTGADRDRPGLFRLAHRGTLFLDEVAEIPTQLQGKLLRAIEERQVRPVGGTEELAADVRLVAATHRKLREQVAAGRFRADLYYRLGVVEIAVPPLRARGEDFPCLVDDLGGRLERETGLPAPRLAADAWRLLREHDWPGNVRELYSLLARASLRAGGATIESRHLPELGGPQRNEPSAAVGLERSMILAALRGSRGSITGAAREIGWTRQKLSRRMKALGLDRRAGVSASPAVPRC